MKASPRPRASTWGGEHGPRDPRFRADDLSVDVSRSVSGQSARQVMEIDGAEIVQPTGVMDRPRAKDIAWHRRNVIRG